MNWLKLSALACSLVWAAPHAHAAEYPTRPIKLIVPYAAGGPTDVLGRMVGEYLGRDLKQPVVVENKAGAQGAIGAEAAARSEPDGYTLFFTAASIFVLNPLLYKKLPYDPVEGFPDAGADHRPACRDGGSSLRARQDGRGVRGLRQAESRANSISDRPAPAAPFISPARCSSRWPASTWSMSPTRAQARR